MFVAAFMVTVHRSAMNRELNIHLLDIGQGDAMILHQPGACALLVDAGPLINGHRLTNKIKTLGIESLEMVIVTHPHLDHFGGLFDLLPRVPAKHFYDNGVPNSSWEYFDDYLALRNTYPYATLSRGMQLASGDIRLDALYPPADPDPEAGINDTSIAMLISFGDFALLHMGDLADEGEKRLLKFGAVPRADIIKIAHHGAADSTSTKLLKAASPDLALISTAARNRFETPANELLERLERHHLPYFRTDRHGDLMIRVGPGGYQINTEKEGEP
jgi:competence protein ComEC